MGISGFSTDVFKLDTTNFTNSLGDGIFSLSQGLDAGKDAIILNFSRMSQPPAEGQVPESSTLLLLLPLLGFGLRMMKRRV